MGQVRVRAAVAAALEERQVVGVLDGGGLCEAANRLGEEVWTGPTPVSAVGATDQHSQVQLFMEGPYDKVITFIRVEDHGVDVPIPRRSGLPEDLAYLAGRSLGELLGAEQDATAAALARSGRMNATITVPKIDAEVFGELPEPVKMTRAECDKHGYVLRFGSRGEVRLRGPSRELRYLQSVERLVL